MDRALDWITANPSAFGSLISAVIAASVAFSVFALTQLTSRRKERVQFLAPKLEELYSHLNKVAEDNASFFKLIYLCLDGDDTARKKISEIDDLEWYGHRTAKRMIMLIRLYFPNLSHNHQLLFSAQRNLNQLKFQLHSDTQPELTDAIIKSGKVGHFLRLMEGEIVRNRDHLLGDYYFWKRYKPTTQADVEAEIPPPEGPIMHPRKAD